MPISPPTEIPLSQITASNGEHAIELLKTLGCAIVSLDDISTAERNKALAATKFYQNANIMLETNPIKEPTLAEKLNPAKFKKRKAPDAASGMVHQYFTPLHHILHGSAQLRSVFDTIYGRTMIYAPNRLRIGNRFKFDDNSLHIEGKNIFEVKDGKIKLLPGSIACIAGISGQRRFVFWDMNGANLKPMYDYWVKNGRKFWTKPDPQWMQQHYAGRRRMVTVDCSKRPHLILWSESTPHEIANSPSLSAFISPIEKFDTNKITKAKATSYHPPEYLGLTYHESNLLGCCYNLPGFSWPAGKKAYAFCHSRAYAFYIDRIRDRYTKLNSKGKKTFQQALLTNGTVDQHTAAYQQALERRGIKLPAVAFKTSTPNFVVDLLTLPDQTLRNYGFIPAKKVVKTEQKQGETGLKIGSAGYLH